MSTAEGNFNPKTYTCGTLENILKIQWKPICIDASIQCFFNTFWQMH